ncbi:hypothetical protein K4G64_37050, partial [Streptomyces sp. WAC04114]|nr:hypothetical protein [Streptomyces sp. WAC04114]
MPGNPRRAVKVAATLTAVQTTLVLFAARATAAPTPTPSPSNDNCSLLSGRAREICEGDTDSGGGGGDDGVEDQGGEG